MVISVKESIGCVNINNDYDRNDDDDEYIIIAVDRSGIKLTSV